MKDKRELIIEAAAEILINENYQTMKTATLANSAGVAEGTLYRYFKNKKEIFVSVLDYLGNAMIESFFVNINREFPLKGNIEIIRNNIKNISRENKFKVIIYGKAFSEIDNDDVKIIMRDIMERGLDEIKKVFSWAIEKDEINLSEEELNIIAISFWGIAEFYIKRSIAGFEIKDNEIENVINFLYKAIKK